jgi:hypothetical protein
MFRMWPMRQILPLCQYSSDVDPGLREFGNRQNIRKALVGSHNVSGRQVKDYLGKAVAKRGG